ncbi:MAG: RNA 2',3'-cyclic phosphodiesterase [Robiginitomaculum sp.]|nr:RNA 2',3'-cyclic phosphodiesterase [Robiginitomaculum sp.]
MRLFAALAVPDQVSEQLLRLQSGVQGAKWRPQENFHITLSFYGDVDEQMAFHLEEALGEITIPAMDLQVSGLGSFGKKKPFALWAGVDGQTVTDREKLFSLADQCAKAGIKAGINLEHRNYQPHLTLAYCRNMTAKAAAQYFAANDGYLPMKLSTDKFSLYCSVLGKNFSRYQVLTEFDNSGL